MKTIKYIILIILVILYFGCNDKSQQKKLEAQEVVKKNAENLINNKIVLQINNQKYSNLGFKNYISIHYANVTDFESDTFFNSRIFDSFIEHKILSFMANSEKIQVDQEEIKEFVEKRNIASDKIDVVSLKNAIKAEKYLYVKIYKDIEISKAEISEYYRKNLQEFKKKA
jgi:hypothetical protein